MTSFLAPAAHIWAQLTGEQQQIPNYKADRLRATVSPWVLSPGIPGRGLQGTVCGCCQSTSKNDVLMQPLEEHPEVNRRGEGKAALCFQVVSN